MESKPTLLRKRITERHSRSDYPWERLADRGWFFVPCDPSHNMQRSMRMKAQRKGIKVSINIARDDAGRLGYLVEVVSGGAPS
jgi:hypothetical protein